MKDDFYKDMNHKRAQDEKSSKKSAGSKKSEEPKHEKLSRSARHKAKEAGDTKEPNKKKPEQKKQPKDNTLSDKLKGYFSAENAAKGKAFFAGQFSAYQNRIKNELKVSKEKLGSIGAASKTAGNKKQKTDSSGKKRMLPWLIAVLVLIPITVLFAFLIFSNFWPSLNDEINLANENASEETADGGAEYEEKDQNSAEFNEALQAQKAEHERRLAENRSGDLASSDLEANYSQEELQELEDASLNAIRSKEDEPAESETENSSDSEDSEESPNEAAESSNNAAESSNNAAESSNNVETADEGADNESQTAAETETPETETETEPSETQNANASHVVTPQDNLYRIAIQYYGDGSSENVQRIMEANGVSPDSLSVGQELIIP